MSSLVRPYCVHLAALVAGVFLTGCESDSSGTEGSWSDFATAPADNIFPAMHGPFGAAPVAVSLRDLPEHHWVRVRFNLIVAGTWDGSSPVWGPDLWTCQVRGGAQLMFTGFSNMGGYSNNRAQAYPDDYPWGVHAAWTGATPLGEKPFPRVGAADPHADAVYPMEFVFPHEGRSLTLDLAGIYNDPPGEKQRWGVAGFEYATSVTPVAADVPELYRFWDELASPDPVRADAAMWRLIATGSRGADFIVARVDALAASIPENPVRPPFRGVEALRLRRAHKALRIADAGGTGRTRFFLEHHFPEYYAPAESRE